MVMAGYMLNFSCKFGSVIIMPKVHMECMVLTVINVIHTSPWISMFPTTSRYSPCVCVTVKPLLASPLLGDGLTG